MGCGVINQIFCLPGNEKEDLFPEERLREADLPDFPKSYGNIQHTVFEFKTGECKDPKSCKPPILLLHELPGLTPSTLRYAETLKKHFTVYVPLLFGEANERSPIKNLWWNYLWNAEWKKTAHTIDFYETNGEVAHEKGISRNITHWLRGLVQWISNNHEGQPIGVIGMCLTGTIPLALVDNPNIRAIVVAQPSLPLMFWGTEFDKASLDLSEVEEGNLKKRVNENFQDNSLEVLGIRFSRDCIAREEKFETLKTVLTKKDQEETVYFRDETITEYNFKAHSTLTGYPTDEERNKKFISNRENVRTFLLRKLYPTKPEK